MTIGTQPQPQPGEPISIPGPQWKPAERVSALQEIRQHTLRKQPCVCRTLRIQASGVVETCNVAVQKGKGTVFRSHPHSCSKRIHALYPFSSLVCNPSIHLQHKPRAKLVGVSCNPPDFTTKWALFREKWKTRQKYPTRDQGAKQKLSSKHTSNPQLPAM